MKKRPFKKAHCGEMPFGRHYSPLEEKSRLAINIAIATKSQFMRKNFNTELQRIQFFEFTRWLETDLEIHFNIESKMEEVLI